MLVRMQSFAGPHLVVVDVTNAKNKVQSALLLFMFLLLMCELRVRVSHIAGKQCHDISVDFVALIFFNDLEKKYFYWRLQLAGSSINKIKVFFYSFSVNATDDRLLN